MKKETTTLRYKVTINFSGYSQTKFKSVEPLEFECKTKNELVKELKDLKLEQDKSVTRVLIEDSATLNEYYYDNTNSPGSGLPPYSLDRFKTDFNN